MTISSLIETKKEQHRGVSGGHTWGPREGGEGGGVALSTQRWRQGAWPLSFYPTQGGIYIRERQKTQKRTNRWGDQSHPLQKYQLLRQRSASDLSEGGLWSSGSAMAERWTRPSACRQARSQEPDPMTAAGPETAGPETERKGTKQMGGRKRDTKAEKVSLFHAFLIIHAQQLWCRGYLDRSPADPSVSVSAAAQKWIQVASSPTILQFEQLLVSSHMLFFYHTHPLPVFTSLPLTFTPLPFISITLSIHYMHN